jgi:hypothetical protein
MGVLMGVVFTHAPAARSAKVLPAFAATIFAGIGLVIFVLAVALAVARFRAAYCIGHRISRTFCVIVAAVTCMEFPLGTALGIFSLIVLARPTVMKLFAANAKS